MGTLAFMLFIAVIILLVDRDNIKKENLKLRRKLKDLKNIASETKDNVEKVVAIEPTQEETKVEKVQEKTIAQAQAPVYNKVVEKPIQEPVYNKKTKEEIKKEQEEVKNTMILITGSILIVLAAVVFLLSTWNTIPNGLKTVTLLLVAGVFLGASSIAKKVFKLEQTSNAFFYMAMTYFPIVILSISVFGLFGEYFSISGEGKHIYFAVSGIALASIYLVSGIQRKQLTLVIASMPMQIFSVIFTALIFVNTFTGVLFSIIIYNLVLTCLQLTKDFGKYGTAVKVFNSVNTIYLSVFAIGAVFIGALVNGCSSLVMINMLLMTFKYHILNVNGKNKGYAMIFHFGILISVLAMVNLNVLGLSVAIKQLIMTLAIVLLYSLGMISKKIFGGKEITIISTIIPLVCLYLSTVAIGNADVIVKDYMILYVGTILAFITYRMLKEEECKPLMLHLVPIGMIFSGIQTVARLEINLSYMIFLSLIIFGISFVRNKEMKNVFAIYGNISFVIAILLSAFTANAVTQLIMTGSIILLYCLGMANKEIVTRKGMTIITTGISLVILYIATLENNEFWVKDFVVVYIATILSFVTYMMLKKEDYKPLMLHLVPIGMIFSGIQTVVSLSISFNYMIPWSLVIFGISFVKNKEMKSVFAIYGNIAFVIAILFSAFTANNVIQLIMTAAIIVMYGLGMANKEITLSKGMTIITAGISLVILYIATLGNDDFWVKDFVVLYIATILAFVTYRMLKEEDYKPLMLHLIPIGMILSGIQTVVSLDISFNYMIPWSLVIFGISFVQNKEYKNVFAIYGNISLVISMLFAEEIYTLGIDWLPIISILLIAGTSSMSILRKKTNVYTGLSIVHILIFIGRQTLGIYVNALITLIWAILHALFFKDNGEKDIFKVVAIISGLVLYNKAIVDLDLTDITAIKLLGYIVAAFVTSRAVLKKHTVDGCKAFEYITSIIIFLIALPTYTSIEDGMIFVFLLLVLTIVGYTMKYGPMFLTSIVAILVNVFLLTKEFWFSVPWWIYLLVVGSILITFAIRNEMNENKQKGQVAEKLKKIKEHVDM